jgi:nitric oxide reductase large subunit
MRTFSLILTPFLFGELILWLLLGATFSTLSVTPFIFAF